MASLFGSQPKPNLFGSLNTNTGNSQQPQQTQSNVFGSFGSGAQQQPQQQQPAQGGGLFGASTQQNRPLFGASQPPQQQQQQSGGLFGAANQQPQQQQSSSLFGTTNQQPQQQQTGSLFGGSQPSLFAGAQSTQNQQTMGASQSTLQPQAQNQSRLGMSSLFQPGSSLAPREKTIPEQMQTILEKWSPESPNCTFQHYFYNRVNPETVPYYGPQPGEDEKKWEEALQKKPAEGDIPVLARGFTSLGDRLRVQVQSVTALQSRLHEINNSLTAQLQEHDNKISVRIADARRRHVALSQRCLNLATKVQVLRNRGYALDGAEEGLKKKLAELEKSAFDPMLSGREEEIWARMVGVRERARFLQEETRKVGAGVAQGESLDEDIVRKTSTILRDYDSQISHLQKEIDEIGKDFTEWEGASKAGK